jgi:regulator of protease activity HflC (stomatin/prohibitin superfamily)
MGAGLFWIILTILVLSVIVLPGGFRRSVVYAGTTGLLYRDGVFERELGPGAHLLFDPLRRTEVRLVPTIPMVLGGHEMAVISKDQFAFKLTLNPLAHIVDARAYLEQVGLKSQIVLGAGVHFPALHARMAAATLDGVAGLTLDEFLADPTAVVAAVTQQLGDATPGGTIDELLLTAITMPPEVRKMFTEVERAKREGLAALERARSEVASLRALANAARSLQDNPQLAHLRTLQAVEGAKGAKTIVLGNLPPLVGPNGS